MLRQSRRGNSQEVVFINLVPTFPGVRCSIWSPDRAGHRLYIEHQVILRRDFDLPGPSEQ